MLSTDTLCKSKAIKYNVGGQIFSRTVWLIFFQSLFSYTTFYVPFFVSLYQVRICVCLCHSCSNRVEAWTRDVQFLLRQEGRPVTQLVGNMSTVRIMGKDWETTDKATQWIHRRAESSNQPFALYLGLELPHPYKTKSLGPTAGGSTFLTSPYWLQKACFFFALFLSVWTPLLHNYITYLNHSKISYLTHPGVFWAHRCSKMDSNGCHAPCGLLFHFYQKLQWFFHSGGSKTH